MPRVPKYRKRSASSVDMPASFLDCGAFPPLSFFRPVECGVPPAVFFGILPPRQPAHKGLLSQGGLADRLPLFQQKKAAEKRRSPKGVRCSLFRRGYRGGDTRESG